MSVGWQTQADRNKWAKGAMKVTVAFNTLLRTIGPQANANSSGTQILSVPTSPVFTPKALVYHSYEVGFNINSDDPIRNIKTPWDGIPDLMYNLKIPDQGYIKQYAELTFWIDKNGSIHLIPLGPVGANGFLAFLVNDALDGGSQ